MTRKDYIAIAGAVRSARQALMYATVNAGETKRCIEIVSLSIAVILQNDNTLFNKDKFLTACEECGVECKHSPRCIEEEEGVCRAY